MLKGITVVMALIFELFGRCFHAVGSLFMDLAITLLRTVQKN